MKKTKKKVKRASPSQAPSWMDNKRRARKDRDDQQLQRDINFIDKMSRGVYWL